MIPMYMQYYILYCLYIQYHCTASILYCMIYFDNRIPILHDMHRLYYMANIHGCTKPMHALHQYNNSHIMQSPKWNKEILWTKFFSNYMIICSKVFCTVTRKWYGVNLHTLANLIEFLYLWAVVQLCFFFCQRRQKILWVGQAR